MLLLIGTQSFFHQAAPVQEAMNTAGDFPDDELDILGRWLDGDKVRPVPRGSPDKDAVGDEDMEVDVEIEGAAKALSCRDRSASRYPQAALLRSSLEVAEDGAQDDSEDGFAQVIVPGEPEPERYRQGEHPLPDRNTGQDALPPPQRPMRHPSPSASWAQAPPLAREPDDAVEPTAGACGTEEALREFAAPHKLPQFPEDEARQRLARFLAALRNRLQVLDQQRRQQLTARLVQKSISRRGGLAGRHQKAQSTNSASLYT